MLKVHITTESVDADRFCGSVGWCLLAYVTLFNPRSVVVMDNASIYCVDKVVGEVGAIFVYLPLYSPNIMPIEECFTKLKPT